MPALRRAARGNGFVTAALIRALVRIAEAAPFEDVRVVADELAAVRDETRESDMLERDVEQFCGQVENAIERI
jgi:hypothetical protein